MLALSTPPERMNLVFSIKQTGVPLGGMLARLLGPSLTDLSVAQRPRDDALAGVACALSMPGLCAAHDRARAPDAASASQR